jgi:hypothetical protein
LDGEEGTVSSDLHALMIQHRDELTSAVSQRLMGTDVPHYRELGTDRVHERASRLVEALLQSLAAVPSAFVDYILEIASTRIGEGYFLKEMQVALSVLEEGSWQVVVAGFRCEDHARHLSRLTTLVGAAKDALARAYLERKRRAEAQVALLEQQLEVLSRGTDAAPVDDPDERGGFA